MKTALMTVDNIDNEAHGMFRKYVLPYLIFSVYKLLYWSWRISYEENEEFKKNLKEKKLLVIAHWHGDELGILYLLKRYHCSIMASTSKDGSLMAKAAELLGSEVSRGSSTRGGAAALKGIFRLAKKGWNPSVAVDGPKGPIYEIKPGVFEISKRLKADIYPLSVAVKKKHVFEKAWNKSFLPLPFTKVQVVVGEPMRAPAREEDSRDPKLAKDLKFRINDARQRAAKLIAATSEEG